MKICSRCALPLFFASVIACSSESPEGAAQEIEEGNNTGGAAGDDTATPAGGTPGESGGAPNTSGGATSGGSVGTGAGGMTASGGMAPDSTGGSDGGLILDGPPPARAEFPATTTHWTLLPDTDEFTNFAGQSPFSIAPLRTENFPPEFDYCHAPGGDAELNQKQQFARAELKADLKTWYYDITLLSVPEEDGLTPYQLVIDGQVVREFTTPPTGTMGAEDREDFPHVWESVPIEEGQVIEIRARAHSNLEITEGANCRSGPGFDDTYAWARGRFNGLIMEPAADASPN